MQTTKYPPTALAVLIYSALSFLAIYFVEERILFADAAYQLFSVLRTDDLAIQAQRYGAGFVQFFPLMAARWGMELKGVMIVYSFAFVLVHIVGYLWIRYGIQQAKMAWVCLFFSITMMTHTFYWIQSEFIQGIVFTLVFFASILRVHQNKIRTGLDVIWYPFAIITILYFHPLLFILFVFLLGYYALQKAISTKKIAAIGVIFIIGFLLKSFILPKPQYDSQALGHLQNFITLFPNYWTIPSSKNFLLYLVRDYYLVLGLLIAVNIYFIKHKKWWSLLWIDGAWFAYLLLINVCFYQAEIDQFYIESQYLPLSIFLLVPFADKLLPALSHKRNFIIAMFAIAVIRVGHIAASSGIYTEKVAWLRDFLDKTKSLPHQKLIINETKLPRETVFLPWGLTYEAFFLSILDHPERVATYAVYWNPDELRWIMGNSNTFGTAWGQFPYDEFRPHLFPLQDTSNFYQMYDYEGNRLVE